MIAAFGFSNARTCAAWHPSWCSEGQWLTWQWSASLQTARGLVGSHHAAQPQHASWRAAQLPAGTGNALTEGSSVANLYCGCLLYTSDAADEEDSVDLGGRRSLKKKNNGGRVETIGLKHKMQ
eukprot:TRINITY_DN9293_c0_g1_i1.p1 TRINITY_DN9293_c0_g1~~TRINITY_DN9293_c0_g1_i1.p1  ORF type:complete len:123 (-),score=13.88 TRINITY_DN9293_c0_g1_i1:20-388(-)